MIPNLITFLIYSGLRGASSSSLRNHSIVPEREGGFPFLFQGREKDPIVPWECVCPLLSMHRTPPSDMGFGTAGCWAERGEAAGGGGKGQRGKPPPGVFKARNWVRVHFLRVFSCQALYPMGLEPHLLLSAFCKRRNRGSKKRQ